MPHPLPSYSAVVVLMFVAFVAGVGYLLSRRSRIRDASDYFLAGCSTGWMSLGASLFVTTIAGGWLLSAGGSSAWQDGPFLFHGMLALLFLFLLGRYAAPRYIDACVYTVPQFMERWYGRSTAATLSGLSIALNLAVRIPIVLVAGSWLLEELFGWDLMSSALLILVVTGLYTIAGGYPAMIMTQGIQAGMILAGCVTLMVSGMAPAVRLEDVGMHIQTTVGGFFGSGMNQGIPWPVPLFGAIVIGIWYWGADQFIIQRIVATRNVRHVRRGTALAVLLVAVVLALVAALLSGSLSPIGELTGRMGDLFAVVVLVSFLSMMMASLAGYFQSTAELFTLDFYQRLKPGANDAQLVLVGRLATTLIVVIAILIVSAADLVGWRTFVFMQEVAAAFAPPIVVLFLAGLSGRRSSDRGALYTLVTGEVFGAAYFGIKFLFSESSGGVVRIGALDALSFASVSFIVSTLVLFWSSTVANLTDGQKTLRADPSGNGMHIRKRTESEV